MPDNSTDTESDNIIKRYQRRPKKLEKLCLADFVACLTVLKIKVIAVVLVMTNHTQILMIFYQKLTDNDPDSINVIESEYKPNEYKLKVGIKLVKRKKPKIIRCQVP